MRTLALLVAFLTASVLAVSAQEAEAPEGALIRSTEVSGSSLNQLSPGLQQDINALVGEKLDRARVTALAARIEAENREVVAAVRALAQPDGQARVVFFIARISDSGNLAANINARYIVESVEISGMSDEDVSLGLRDRLQALVGDPLDPDKADELNEDLESEHPEYSVTRRMERGSQPGRIRVIFEFERLEPPPWIRFRPPASKFVFHSDQKWSGAIDIPMGGSRQRFTAGFVFDNNDDLIEEYSGFRLRLESRKLGTDRLGASIEVSRFRQEWEPETLSALAADPRIPEPYRERVTVEPTITVAFSPNVRARVGVSVAELESLSNSPSSTNANAWISGISFDRFWRMPSDSRQAVGAGYELRTATEALGSDHVYKRHLANVFYGYERDHSNVIANLRFGYITGRAPLFERFSLGDTSTLRGWNKYDIAPAGGERMFHSSLEYRFWGFAIFMDTGSVWDRDADVRMRVATGFGFHHRHAFVTVGFPLNADDVTGTFMMGVRF